jgi:hypothetical protein
LRQRTLDDLVDATYEDLQDNRQVWTAATVDMWDYPDDEYDDAYSDDDYDDDGFLKEEVKEEYEEKFDDIDEDDEV